MRLISVLRDIIFRSRKRHQLCCLPKSSPFVTQCALPYFLDGYILAV